MSVELHITRAEYWFDGSETPITLEEWLAYVDSRPDLRLVSQSREGCALYLGPTLNNPRPRIDLQSGNLVCTCPDTLLFQEMLRIAEDLGARVQDEDDKTYSNPGQWSYDPDTQWERKAAASAEYRARIKAQGKRPLNRPRGREIALNEIASLMLGIMQDNWAEVCVEAMLGGSSPEFSARYRDESGEETEFELSGEIRDLFVRLRGFAADDETRYWSGCKFRIGKDGEFSVGFSYS